MKFLICSSLHKYNTTRSFCQQILDEKCVWRSRKQIVPEPLGPELRVVISLCHLLIQTRQNSTCFSTQVLTLNSSSGNFPLSAVRSRLRSTDGVSQRSLLTAAMHPACKFLLSCTGSLLRFSPIGCVCR